MPSMPTTTPTVIGGVDCHADTHTAVALDGVGRRLADAQFPATDPGYQALLAWLGSFGQLTTVGVESTGSYGAGLTRYLLAHTEGVTVVEVNQPHPHTRRRRGKSDPLDAEAAARKALSGEATAVPKDTTGIVEAVRLLRVARAGAVKAHTAAHTATLNQLRELLVTAPAPLRQHVQAQRKTLQGRVSVCARLRPDLDRLADPTQAAKLALRATAERALELDRQAAQLNEQLTRLVGRAAPRTTGLLGVSTGHAGQLLVTAGQNLDRLRSEAAFAHLCAADPIPASSGKTIRHRLNPGGDRDANTALHLIAVARLRYCQRTRAYTTRRLAQGRSKREIIRCLKRYIAREVYHTLRADLAALTAT
jgi:transposase